MIQICRQRLVVMERGWKPNVEISPNCPTCGSSNTKFCYYNNYSLTQPRYFCKGCRRYWTKGGSLRNVPVGGGCRKSRPGNKKTLKLRQFIHRVEHSDDLKRASSSIPSLGSDGPNIDLVQVYASFLNQKHSDSKADLEKPHQVQTVFHASPKDLSLSNTDFGQSSLPEELGLTRCLHLHEQSTESHFTEEGSVQMYFCGLNPIQKHLEYSTCHGTENLELPPLPGEEALPSHDMLWSNSDMMVDHALQATQSPLFGAEAHDAELLMGNWSPFDLSSWDASFFRP